MKSNEEILSTLSNGLNARNIRYAQPKLWEKEDVQRIYLSVRGKSEGYLELKESTIEMHDVNRLQLFAAIKEILNLHRVPVADFYEGSR